MEIIVKQTISLEELIERSWQGARDTWKFLQDNDLMDIAEELLIELSAEYPEGIDEFELNDYIWFELVEDAEQRATDRREAEND